MTSFDLCYTFIFIHLRASTLGLAFDDIGLHLEIRMVHDRSDNDHEFPEQDSMVKLHPIVLLTMTDYIGRHTLQKKQDPILGAILGQRNEHGCTMEVAFEFRLHNDSRKPQVPFDSAWFDTRLNLCKKSFPPMDLF